MIMIPFPLVIAEFVIFFLAVKQWGFFNTLGIYLLPCLLGFFIVTTVGRLALLTMQKTVTRGQLPGNQILNSGAIFLSGLLFLIPSFFARIAALVLFLPGLRHMAVWRFKLYLAKQMAKGTSNFRFGGMGGGPFGFGNGGGGFQYYEFKNDGTGFRRTDVGADSSEGERDVYEANVLDVTPLKVTHETKSDDQVGPKDLKSTKDDE
jgi:UPF0716 protein FxsA